MAIKFYKNPGYPFNLVDAVFDCEYIWVDDDDHTNGLNHALESLTEREQDVLRKRYKENKTLDEIGNEFGLTRERIRQIEKRSIAKLRHPSRKNFILHGYIGNVELKELKAKEELLNEREKTIKEREDKLAEALEHLVEIRASVDLGMSTAEVRKAVELGTSIENMDLSVRSYNCLKRSGINTINELVYRCENDWGLELLKVRNLGRKSLQEILDKLYYMTGKDFRAQYRL